MANEWAWRSPAHLEHEDQGRTVHLTVDMTVRRLNSKTGTFDLGRPGISACERLKTAVRKTCYKLNRGMMTAAVTNAQELASVQLLFTDALQPFPMTLRGTEVPLVYPEGEGGGRSHSVDHDMKTALRGAAKSFDFTLTMTNLFPDDLKSVGFCQMFVKSFEPTVSIDCVFPDYFESGFGSRLQRFADVSSLEDKQKLAAIALRIANQRSEDLDGLGSSRAPAVLQLTQDFVRLQQFPLADIVASRMELMGLDPTQSVQEWLAEDRVVREATLTCKGKSEYDAEHWGS